MKKRVLIAALSLAFAATPPLRAQSTDVSSELSAMEMTLFGQVHSKDALIKRVERLEVSVMDYRQRDKDLPTRIDMLMEKVKPSQDLLNRKELREDSGPSHFWNSQKGKKSAAQPKSFRGMFAGQPQSEFFEEYNYPYIKWAVVKWTGGGPDSVIRLSTEFVATGAGFGRLKYKIDLQSENSPRMIYITFLDQNGFKLSGFSVDGRSFEQSPDKYGRWTASESVSFNEKDYKQARQYTAR